jgi:hypothetical protein
MDDTQTDYTRTIVDCSTGEVWTEPFTAEEIARHRQNQAEYAAQADARDDDRRVILLAAHKDPRWAAVARLLGLLDG